MFIDRLVKTKDSIRVNTKHGQYVLLPIPHVDLSELHSMPEGVITLTHMLVSTIRPETFVIIYHSHTGNIDVRECSLDTKSTLVRVPNGPKEDKVLDILVKAVLPDE